MVQEKILYACSICGEEYTSFDDAVSCEARGFQPFKVPLNKRVSVIAKGDLLAKGERYEAQVIAQKRRLEAGQHINWYEVQFIGSNLSDIQGNYREEEIERQAESE